MLCSSVKSMAKCATSSSSVCSCTSSSSASTIFFSSSFRRVSSSNISVSIGVGTLSTVAVVGEEEVAAALLASGWGGEIAGTDSSTPFPLIRSSTAFSIFPPVFFRVPYACAGVNPMLTMLRISCSEGVYDGLLWEPSFNTIINKFGEFINKLSA